MVWLAWQSSRASWQSNSPSLWYHKGFCLHKGGKLLIGQRSTVCVQCVARPLLQIPISKTYSFMAFMPEEQFGSPDDRLSSRWKKGPIVDGFSRSHTESSDRKRHLKSSNSCWGSWFRFRDEKFIPTLSHCSYDFAQQIHFPFNAQQTGPEYFKTARKCALFCV